MYTFDEIVDRHNTGCIKYDSLTETFGRSDLNSLWIADMDFKTPDFIVDALKKRIEHPIFGYPATPDDYFSTISEWVSKLHGWDVDPTHIRYIPGIVKGIAFAERCFLQPGDKVVMSGPYGEFRPQYGTGREMIWVGGGAGMAPLRAQIMHLLKTLKTRDREMHYFYGARAIDEVFFMEDFLELEKEFPNFHFHLALDRPDPKADAMGVKYTAGFIAPVMGDTYLKQHEAPEDIEYYLCGPPMMAKTVLDLLHSLGVEDDMIRFDNFGG